MTFEEVILISALWLIRRIKGLSFPAFLLPVYLNHQAFSLEYQPSLAHPCCFAHPDVGTLFEECEILVTPPFYAFAGANMNQAAE